MRRKKQTMRRGDGFPLRIAIRGFKDAVIQFVDHVEIDSAEAWEVMVLSLAKKHHILMNNITDKPIMLEIEFLDEPDENQRYFRFGTDPRGMVHPIGLIDLREPN